MRLFLGLDLPIDVKQRIHQYLLPLQKSLKGWENYLDYHLTLKFIGEVEESEKDKISRNLKDFVFEPFSLSLDQFYFFNRRIMYLGVVPSETLVRLKTNVEKAFTEWGKKEEKEFIPHVTVKRWQRYEFRALKEGLEQRPFSGGSFLVDSLILFKSEKIAPDRKYQILEIKKL